MIYAGCDLGIVSAKAVIIENGDILAFQILPYKNLPRQAAVEVMDKALANAGLDMQQVKRCFATGFGQEAVPYAQRVVADTFCLAKAVNKSSPAVRTIIDVGGHSLKCFNVNREGKVVAEAITDRCTAGTGKFIEIIANALELPLDELIEASCGSKNPVPITNTCVIFAESDVISYVSEGKERHDIFAGLASSVAARIAGIVRRISVDREVALTGGVAKNRIVVRDLEEELGLKFADLDGVDPQILGAFGAALLAEEGGYPSR